MNNLNSMDYTQHKLFLVELLRKSDDPEQAWIIKDLIDLLEEDKFE